MTTRSATSMTPCATSARRRRFYAAPSSTSSAIALGLLLFTCIGISRSQTHSSAAAAGAIAATPTSSSFVQQYPAGSAATGFAVVAATSVATPYGHNYQPELPTNCSEVRTILDKRGIAHASPTLPVENGMLRFCDIPAKGACCQNSMELATLSRQQLDKNTKESIAKLSSVLGTRAVKFNDFFMQLLAESKKEFHDMFKRTYGVIYEQNSYVFSDLFVELESYYTRGKVDLAEALDNFFNVLYQKMFTVLNMQYKFDDKYLACVSEHMKELKPFGDVPDKLSVQIKRSFVATRTYEQALATASEVAKNLISLRPSAECVAALTRMQQCGVCSGYAEKPCSNYCVNVMKGCLHYYAELDAEWDNFVASMEKLSERLLGPFNIVMVVEPINIKISEAIMNFQDTGDEITKQVFQGCGKPQLGGSGPQRRRRSVNPKFQDAIAAENSDHFRFADDQHDATRVARSADPGNRELQFEPLKFSRNHEDSAETTGANQGGRGGTAGRRKTNNKQKNRQQSNQNVKKDEAREDNKEPLIDKLVKDIRQKVKDSKKFWSNLPFQICNQEDYAASVVRLEGNCWNGHSVDKYPHPIVQDIASNPEFSQKAMAARQSSLVASQLFMLKTAVGHLRNAQNGLDVEWTDVEDSYEGSGSGSGAGVDDEDGDGGSGMGYDYPSRVPDHSAPVYPDSSPPTSHHDDRAPTTTTTTVHSDDDRDHHNTHHEYDERENEVNPHDRKKGGTASSGSRLGATTGMSLRQALLTYAFPIYMAWFGGILCDLF